jgi:lipoprotein-releasing system permease protein
MPLLAAVAVMLCSAMVLVTWSIMGGFLTMFLDVGRNVEGDVGISWPTVGFAHYDDLIKRLEADPMVAAACPTIEAFGMVSLPDDRLLGVRIRGIDERYAKVAQWNDAIWWKPISTPMPKDRSGADPRLKDHAFYEQLLQDGLTLTKRDPKTGLERPGVVTGIEMSGFSLRQDQGWYDPAPGILKRKVGGANPYEAIDGFIVNHSVTINVLPMDRGGRNIGVVSRRLPVVNEFRTGVFEFDKGVVMMNLGELQRMLKMDQAERLESRPRDPYAISDRPGPVKVVGEELKVLGIEPARVTHVFVKAKPGIAPEQLRERCEGIYSDFAAQFGSEVPPPAALARARSIATWEQNYGMFIAAVKKEIALVLGLLVFISVVAVFLVLAIFWAMVSEKTKDVGVLRAVGASRSGVAWLWLRYGLTLGVVGTVLGLATSYAIVWNINPIHEWLGRAFGLALWDPKVYYFSEIPRHVEPVKAIIVVVGAILFSVVGALVPALRAASYDPVKSLRFE